MKKIFATMAILMVSVSGFASNELDGKEFCRTLGSGGMGAPSGVVSQHCITMADGIATDSANGFWGNPPESSTYTVKGRILTFGTSKYVLAKDLSDIVTVSGSAVEGTVLTAK